MMSVVFSLSQTHLPIPPSIQISCSNLQPTPKKPSFLHIIPQTSIAVKCQRNRRSSRQTTAQDDGIPVEEVNILVKFKSRHNYIRVLEVSRKANHPFAGSRLLLLDGPGNIHSISFLFKSFTNTYFDVFATLPPILPPGPVGILGFGAGSAARLILELYPEVVIHGWELDPSVIEVGRKYFSLAKLEREYPHRLFIYIGNGLKASLKDGFAGILVDLFSKGSLIPELQDPTTWEKISKCLREGGRIMVNVGGSCVEAENKQRDGKAVMEESLKAMERVFGKKLFALNLGNRKDDSSLALTGDLPEPDAWKKALPRSLRKYVDLWTPYSGSEKASPTSSGSRVGWRKMDNNGGTEGSDGGMSLGNVEEGFRFRSLRSERRVPSPPPAPARNPAKSTVKPPVFGFRPRSPPPPPPPPPCIH